MANLLGIGSKTVERHIKERNNVHYVKVVLVDIGRLQNK